MNGAQFYGSTYHKILRLQSSVNKEVHSKQSHEIPEKYCFTKTGFQLKFQKLALSQLVSHYLFA